MGPAEKMAEWARSQVGYAADSNKRTKYGEMLDNIGFYNGPKNGYDWCEQFYDAGMVINFGEDTALAMMNAERKGGGAGCWISAQDYRDAGQWSNVPSIGAQIYFGVLGDESHTGCVVGYTDSTVGYVDGNTGYSQGYATGAVLYHELARDDGWIVGYGVPDWALAEDGRWVHTERGWWYQRKDGSYPKSQWERINGKWYWFDSAGYIIGGWLHYKDDWYWLHDEHDGHFGEMAESVCLPIDGKTYCFDASGRMYKGSVPTNTEHDGTFGALKP